MSESHYDVAIIGGGIVGLATALELTERFPRERVVVLEKEAFVARHQTGHNSGVIHSGIYYRPGSDKARLCVEGAKLMVGFCQANGIPFISCGKVVVATGEDELPRLAKLYEQGIANGVAGIEIIGPDRLRQIEPYANGVRALHSPLTAIVDYRTVARKMESVIIEKGASILTDAKVVAIARGDGALHLETHRGDVRAKRVINCGGLYADRIARMMGERLQLRIIPFRGEYYRVCPAKKDLVKGLIYPVPDPAFPFLGVHFTRTIGGEVEAGPNAVLALAREGYTKFSINLLELLDTLGYRGFWAMVRRYWRTGIGEIHRSISKKAFLLSLQRLVPTLEACDIEPAGAGVRAQAVGLDGRLLDDFKIIANAHAIHVLNAPSPAATASVAIARRLVSLASRSFALSA